MNLWQVLQQMKYVAQREVWPGGNNAVWAGGSVVVTLEPEDTALDSLIFPILLIRPLSSDADATNNEEPGFIRTTVGAVIGTMVPGDQLGEKSLLGGNRPDMISSEGRGLLEVEERLLAALKLMNSIDGVSLQVAWAGAGDVSNDGDDNYYSWRAYRFRVDHADAKTFHPSPRLNAVPASGGADVDWILPPDRWDRLRVALVRKNGSIPPADLNDGTRLVLAGDLATSYSDAAPPGVYSYSVFGVYDENGNGDEEQISAPTSKSVLVS